MKNKKEIIGVAVWLFMAAYVMMASWNLGLGEYSNPGPGFFPFWSALLLGALALLLTAKIFLQKKAVTVEGESPLWKGLHWGKTITVMVALFTYYLILPKLGFMISTMGLMMVLFFIGKMKPWAVIIGSLLSVLLSYCLFLYGLKTPLPRGIWFF